MDAEGLKPLHCACCVPGLLLKWAVGLCTGVSGKGTEEEVEVEVEVMFSCPLSLAANCPAFCKVLHIVCKC